MDNKKRCTNFTRDEVEVLVDLVEKYKDIVECKKTDSVSCTTKTGEWENIVIKFNSLCGTARTARMLRSKWESLKKITKKEYANNKLSLYKTGGGPPADNNLNGVNRRVLAIIGVGAMGTVSQYDSDFVANDSPVSPASNNAHPTTIEILPNNAEMSTSYDGRTNNEQEIMIGCSTNNGGSSVISCEAEETVQEHYNNWTSWNPAQLRQPKTKALQLPSSSAPADIRETTVLSGGEINTLTKLQTPNSNKRRRFYKAESTSDKLKMQRSQSVYEKLAEKKIDFINFQIDLLKKESDRKEERLAEKHKLEMEILKEELKNKQGY